MNDVNVLDISLSTVIWKRKAFAFIFWLLAKVDNDSYY